MGYGCDIVTQKRLARFEAALNCSSVDRGRRCIAALYFDRGHLIRFRASRSVRFEVETFRGGI